MIKYILIITVAGAAFAVARATVAGQGDVEATRSFVSTEELESSMLPPENWKVDLAVLDRHFWLIKYPLGFSKEFLALEPFWPVFVPLEVNPDKNTLKTRVEGYVGDGVLLQRALKSDDTTTRSAAKLWLRQCLTIYFAGFRLGGVQDVSYAPWITPDQQSRINIVVDKYLAQLKPMTLELSDYGRVKQSICTDLVVFGAMSNLEDKRRTTVINYYGVDQISYSVMPTFFIYPLYWFWVPGDTTDIVSVYQPYFNEEVNESYMFHLISGGIPKDENDKKRLWCRDAYLAFVAGKLLFDNKMVPVEGASQRMLLDAAVQNWWRNAGELNCVGATTDK